MILRILFFWLITTLFLFSCGDQNPDSEITHTIPGPSLTDNIGDFDFENAKSAVSENKSFEVYLGWIKGPTAGPNKNNSADVYLKVQNNKAFEIMKFQPKMNCCGTEPPQKQSRSIVENNSHRVIIKNIYFHAAGPNKSWKLIIDLKIDGEMDRAELFLDEIK